MKRKFLTLFLTLAASVGTIFAETGTCGPNATWEWTEDGVLAIEGSGEMYDYTSSPWATYEITDVYIGNNITKIGKCAFRYLTKLQFVEIGSGVTSIGAAAFEECSGLKTIFCRAINPPTCEASTVFDGINLSKVNVNVPVGSKTSYKQATVWEDFENMYSFGDGLCGKTASWAVRYGKLSINGSGVIYDYTSAAPWSNCKDELTTLVITDKLTEIGNSAFRYLNRLTNVSLGEGITKIGAAAFEECSSLDSLTCKAVTPPTWAASTVFDGINLSKVTLFVPKGCVAAYQAADGWKNFTDIQPIGGSQGKKIYATVDDAGTTLTIDYTNDPSEKAVDFWPSELFPNVTTMELKPSMQDARPTKLDSWFDNYTKLTTIKHLEYLNTSEVTDMSYQFQNCWALKELDLSTFDTKNVTNMEVMFYGCEALESLNLTGWNTENVTTMKSMFGHCEKLKELDLTSFNVEKTGNVEYMFQECKELTTIYCNDDWSAPNRPLLSDGMFTNCEKIKGGNGTLLDKNNVNIKYARPDKKGQPGYFTERATGIENVSAAKRNEATKFLRNGELFILRDGKTYNAEGKEVK